MFDAARLVALIVAASACFRPRYALGLVVVLALIVLDAPSMVIPVVHRGEAPPNAFYAFALLLWGPSCAPAVSQFIAQATGVARTSNSPSRDATYVTMP